VRLVNPFLAQINDKARDSVPRPYAAAGLLAGTATPKEQ
jgi:hypothetical protein